MVKKKLKKNCHHISCERCWREEVKCFANFSLKIYNFFIDFKLGFLNNYFASKHSIIYFPLFLEKFLEHETCVL